jgi:hypothetical protein
MEVLLILIALAGVALLGAAAESFGYESPDPQTDNDSLGVR